MTPIILDGSSDLATPMNDSPASTYRYFVDEAGDLTFFDNRGRSLLGQDGVSSCFIVGAALIHEPEALAENLNQLRESLVSDPYFAGVPSMSPRTRKTAVAFHAKNDLPEVRREVFRVLRDFEVEVYAGVRRKRIVMEDLRAHFKQTGRKLRSDFIYDELVTSIFKDRLHRGSTNHIVFARRGKSDRNVALTKAIEIAKRKFELRWRKGIDRPTTVVSSTPSDNVGLQVADYYLWALQRLIERRESRYFDLLAPAFKLVIDRDDRRRHGYGEYYTASSNPLSLEKLMPVI